MPEEGAEQDPPRCEEKQVHDQPRQQQRIRFLDGADPEQGDIECEQRHQHANAQPDGQADVVRLSLAGTERKRFADEQATVWHENTIGAGARARGSHASGHAA